MTFLLSEGADLGVPMETESTAPLPQPLTFLGYRRSCRWRRWSPSCRSSPGSGCRTPGYHPVATDDAGWSDEALETDLCKQRVQMADLHHPLLTEADHCDQSHRRSAATVKPQTGEENNVLSFIHFLPNELTFYGPDRLKFV